MGRNASFPPIWYVVYRAVLTLNNTSGKQWVPIGCFRGGVPPLIRYRALVGHLYVLDMKV